MDAVKQRAHLAGIDMRAVLQYQDEEKDEQHPDDKDSNRNKNGNASKSSSASPSSSSSFFSLPPALISKYKRMLKSGVPLPAVQQLAFVEGGWNPDQIIQIFESAVVRPRSHHHSGAGTSEQDHRSSYKPPSASASAGLKRAHSKVKLAKYRRMIKVGVPISAVEQRVMFDQAKCNNISYSVLDDEDREHEEHFKIILDDIRQVQDAERTTHFSITEKGVKLHFKSPLATLLQKIAQTVHSSSKAATTKDDEEMDVDHEILYNALGALQGIQVALDDYNSTIADCNNETYSDAEIKIRRQAFLEIAKSTSIKLPSTLKSCAYISIPGLDELVSHICSRYGKKIAHAKDQLMGGTYDFDSLGYLYLPGSKVVAKNVGGSSDGGGAVDMMCLVAWNRYEMGISSSGKVGKVFKVCFKYIVALSPSEATVVEVVEEMPFFRGCRLVIDHLTFVPLGAYSVTEQNHFLNIFENRGKTYNEVVLSGGSFSHMDYQKGSFFLKHQILGLGIVGGTKASKVNSFAAGLASGGRVIVDIQGAYEHGHTLSYGYDPMVMGIKYKFKEYQLYARTMEQTHNSNKNDLAQCGPIIFHKVPDRYLSIVWPYVVGFSLTMKAWGDVLVDGMTHIKWKNDMFDCLVLPQCHKRMIKALVQNNPSSFQDLVEGKGQGTVFLMYGSPGVGKTLTAEAIAEVLQKPLYSISMGSMGTTAHELEGNLTFIMDMSTKWGALILLDEADSFLETRSSSSSLERNAMVCVMLKLVEYFSGILFLTSNCIDAIDPAFLTRITLALHYDSLDENARKRVWENLLIKSGYENLLQNGTLCVEQLAKVPLNGREIKNALRLAISIAAEDGMTLSQKTLAEMAEMVNGCKQRIQKSFHSGYSTKLKKEKGCNKCFKWW